MSLEYLGAQARVDQLLVEAATQRQAAIARRVRRRRKPVPPRVLGRWAQQSRRAMQELPNGAGM